MRHPRSRTRAFGAVFFLVMVATSLAKDTKLITSWKNPEVTGGNFKKVLVIGISRDPGRRSDFEDALAASLSKPGLEIIPGNTLLLRPDTSALNLDYIRAQIKENQIDAVVVSRLIGITESYTYVPPYYSSFYGYYGAVYPVVYSPGYLIEDKTVRIETNVYAITPPDGKLLWTGTSDTFNPSDAHKVIKSVVKVISAELKKAGVI